MVLISLNEPPYKLCLTVKNYAAAIQKALERDGEKLSPVDLCLSEAVAIKLPPLNWNLYHTVPINMTAKNSGFTGMFKI